MIALFHRSRRRFSRPARSRRNRVATVAITPERLEQRIALDASGSRGLLEQALQRRVAAHVLAARDRRRLRDRLLGPVGDGHPEACFEIRLQSEIERELAKRNAS